MDLIEFIVGHTLYNFLTMLIFSWTVDPEIDIFLTLSSTELWLITVFIETINKS